MARYVVIEFEHNDDADLFVGDMDHDGETIVGIFAKPTQFHDATGCAGKGRIRPWVRGKKFGWWVCGTCKKPAQLKSQEKLMRHVICQGRNLLTQPLREDEYSAPVEVASTFDEGWGVLARGK